eukprot:scaffold1316_cov72-Skeletonema_dohrnii-CCMP3373.AAC.2
MGYLLTWGGDGWAQKTRLHLHIAGQRAFSCQHSVTNMVEGTGEIDLDLDMGIDITEEYHRGGLSSHSSLLESIRTIGPRRQILLQTSLRQCYERYIKTIELLRRTSDMQSMRQFTLFSSSPGARAAEGVKHTSTARCEEGDSSLWNLWYVIRLFGVLAICSQSRNDTNDRPIRWARFCWTSPTEVSASCAAAPSSSLAISRYVGIHSKYFGYHHHSRSFYSEEQQE